MNLYHFIASRCSRFPLKLTAIIILAASAAFTQFSSASYLSRITDSIAVEKDAVIAGTVVILLIVSVHFAVSFLLEFLIRNMTNRLALLLRGQTAETICHSDYRALSDWHDGDLFTIASEDISEISQCFHILADAVQGPLKIFIVFCALIRMNWILFVLSLVLYPLVLLPSLLLSKNIYDLNLEEKQAQADNMNFLKETLNFLIVLKSFCLEHIFITKNQEHLSRLEHARLAKQKRSRLIQALSRCAGSLINPFLFTIAAYSILNGDMTLGQVISLVLYIDIAGESINQLTSLGSRYQAAKTCAVRLSAFLSLPDESDAETVLHPLADSPVFDVRQVSFAYSHKNILKDISFEIHSGDKVAVIGKSGCGKSTLFKLLNGLFKPDSGVIFFHGQDTAELSAAKLRKHIGVVPQESFIFPDTIFNNILIARPDASEDDARQACRLAQIHDFIETLPDGYHTRLNNVIVSLSNGQMQRLNLARAFLRNADVWLFDEPTSALDARTRDSIMEYITQKAEEKTVLCVIHEPELMSYFSVCIELENGQISRITRRSKEELLHD